MKSKTLSNRKSNRTSNPQPAKKKEKEYVHINGRSYVNAIVRKQRGPLPLVASRVVLLNTFSNYKTSFNILTTQQDCNWEFLEAVTKQKYYTSADWKFVIYEPINLRRELKEQERKKQLRNSETGRRVIQLLKVL
ncbi:hypothetical protein ACQ4M3_09750 [Leptolyngbya sp. AN03gr2]|uniref:hypothetical protein n=1 Tax=Leptolyngbya sp. AN03gr2 TaxID=3423364 RepID=UPI003D31548B